ncbi:hypothetical protein GW916_02965 [bacterium]|nr:hypothetical protein [bacterium]
MMTWFEYLKEFWLLVPIVLIAAPALFVAGSQALAQSKTLDIFILVQGTVLGHLVALSVGAEGSWELLLCYAFAALALFASHFVEKVANVYHSSLRIAFYALLLVSVYVFERWIPGLERHINTAFVGDLLFLSGRNAALLVGVVTVYLVYSAATIDSHLKRFFSRRVLKVSQKTSHSWLVLNFLLLVSGTHFLGLSFVLGFAVIIPFVFCLGLADKSQKSFLKIGSFSSAALAGGTMLLSFVYPDQSTSPFVVILSVLVLLFILTGRIYVKKFQSS